MTYSRNHSKLIMTSINFAKIINVYMLHYLGIALPMPDVSQACSSFQILLLLLSAHTHTRKFYYDRNHRD